MLISNFFFVIYPSATISHGNWLMTSTWEEHALFVHKIKHKLYVASSKEKLWVCLNKSKYCTYYWRFWQSFSLWHWYQNFRGSHFFPSTSWRKHYTTLHDVIS